MQVIFGLSFVPTIKVKMVIVKLVLHHALATEGSKGGISENSSKHPEILFFFSLDSLPMEGREVITKYLWKTFSNVQCLRSSNPDNNHKSKSIPSKGHCARLP